MWILYKSSLVIKFCRTNMAITYNAWAALYGSLLNYNPKRCNLPAISFLFNNGCYLGEMLPTSPLESSFHIAFSKFFSVSCSSSYFPLNIPSCLLLNLSLHFPLLPSHLHITCVLLLYSCNFCHIPLLASWFLWTHEFKYILLSIQS